MINPSQTKQDLESGLADGSVIIEGSTMYFDDRKVSPARARDMGQAIVSTQGKMVYVVNNRDRYEQAKARRG